MKNETISRIILILEIAAIIVFHSVRSYQPANDKIVREFHPLNSQQSTHILLTAAKQAN